MTDIITGTLAALMGFGTLLYSYRKWVQKKPGNLRIHITLGILCITVCLIHNKTERGQKAEQVTQEVISSQSLKVDIVSGATNSSKVILKAIENALESSAEK